MIGVKNKLMILLLLFLSASAAFAQVKVYSVGAEQNFAGKRVYFCGEDFFNHGIVGIFSIHDVFYSGGVLSWRVLDTSLFDYINVENWVTATPSYDVGDGLLELATSADHSTYLLQTTDYPAKGITTTMPWLVKFDHNVSPISTVQAAACNYRNQSLDMALSGMYPRSSGQIPKLITYEPITIMASSLCKHPAELPVKYSSIGIRKPYMYEGSWYAFVPSSGAYRYAAAVNVQIICN